jgi:argininosuccinate lyase
VGQIVRYCEKQGVTFGDLSLTEWRSFSKEFGEDTLQIISPLGAIEAKRSPGGTAPERVKEQLEKARRALES